jgi:protein-arginine kinase activator protein McsA
MTGQQDAEAGSTVALVCAGCDRSLEDCAFCDEVDCGCAVCYRCCRAAIGESMDPVHAHGG